MMKNELYKDVAGYDAMLERRAKNIAEGADYLQQRGKVQATIDVLHPHRIPMIVSDIIKETASSKTIRLKPQDNRALPVFQAGQYVNLFVSINGVQTARPFAISSSPQTRSHYDVTVRAVAGGFVSPYLMEHLSVGQTVSTTGPMGNFYYNPIFHGPEVVFLAGGSGIAPAMSMIKSFSAMKPAPKMHLIYGSRSEKDIIFVQQLKDLESEHEFLTLTYVISDPSPSYTGHQGFLNKKLIETLVTDVEDKTFYICGPTIMNELCRNALTALGVKKGRIRVEANGPPREPQNEEDWPPNIAADKPVTIAVQGRGQFQSIVGEPILNALERNGFNAENACRSGECSLCRIRLVSGNVYQPQDSKLRASDKKFGWIHSCVAYPLEDIEIDI